MARQNFISTADQVQGSLVPDLPLLPRSSCFVSLLKALFFGI